MGRKDNIEHQRQVEEQNLQDARSLPIPYRVLLGARKHWKVLVGWLGGPFLFDFIRDYFLGKMLDSVYERLGSFGQWFRVYPFATLTIGVCVLLAWLIVEAIKQSNKSENSIIYDENDKPYTRARISKRWAVIFCVVMAACIGILGYGTYRYVQISVGHFKNSDNTYNIVLPIPPGAPVPLPAKPPSSVLDLFNDDFPTLFKARNEISLEGTNIRLKQQVYLDFFGKADFIGFYIPAFSADISGNDTAKLCTLLVNQTFAAVAALRKHTGMLAGFGPQATALDDLTFTGRVLIYHENWLSITQEAEIINAYRHKNLDVQFRSGDYLMDQRAMWKRQHDAQQGH